MHSEKTKEYTAAIAACKNTAEMEIGKAVRLAMARFQADTGLIVGQVEIEIAKHYSAQGLDTSLLTGVSIRLAWPFE